MENKEFMTTAVDLVRRFRQLRVLVIGDAMLDTYLEGSAARLCSDRHAFDTRGHWRATAAA